MKSYLYLENKQEIQLPEKFRDDDVRYTSELVKHFIDLYTEPGDLVFDPFAGYGTTLKAAEEMGRDYSGIEFLSERIDYISTIIKNKSAVIEGDALKLETYGLPAFDLSMTSPPYMCRGDEENPFTSYRTGGNGYDAYLEDLKKIYGKMKVLMKEKAHIVIEAANLKHDGKITPLAWDIAAKLSEILTFEGEIIVNWDSYGYGYDHSYCLVFTK